MTASNARRLLSTVTPEGQLVLSVEPVQVPAPQAHEVVVQVRATPFNPSDLALLLAPADLKTARTGQHDGHPALIADLQPAFVAAVAGRVAQKLCVGNEGAGVVVAAGSDPQAQDLLGKTVTVVGGQMYQTHRVLPAAAALPLPDGADPVEGASLFVNPMTVQAFVWTMRSEGHTAMVHTAAASNLGQMLARLCVQEGIPLVAVVRSASQRALLAEIGLNWIVDSSSETFQQDLVDAIQATGATLAFDAIGGGPMANDLLKAMEQAQLRSGTPTSPYGTTVHKQVYLYGRLDPRPTTLTYSYGMYYGVGGWLVTPRLAQAGPERTRAMRQRAIDERNGLFASDYTRTVGLDDLLDPEVVRAIDRKATGQKFLLDPGA